MVVVNHNCRKQDNMLQTNVQNAHGKFSGLYVNFKLGEHMLIINGIVTKHQNSRSGCKNEQQADFEVQLENRNTSNRH